MKEENGGELPERIVYVRPESLLSTECLLILTRVLLFVFGSPVRHVAAYLSEVPAEAVFSLDRFTDPCICRRFAQTSTSARR